MIHAVCPNDSCAFEIDVDESRSTDPLQCPQCQTAFVPDTGLVFEADSDALTVPSEPDLSVQETVKIPCSDEPLPGTMFGGFKILEEIAEGGMGKVYKALQMSLQREVALKILQCRFSTEHQYVERFLRESSSMARLEHPNIVNIIDRGEVDGQPFIAMPYIQCSSLRTKTHNKMPMQDVLHYLLGVAAGLQYAHNQGIVHRDIKPDNILIDHNNTAKIADFGIAGFTEQPDTHSPALTMTNMVMGTRAYMAPEQGIDAKSADGRADIYSLGVVAYELLTGMLPTGKFKHPSELRSDLPGFLDEVLDKMLANDAKDRYQTCNDLITDLQRLQSPGTLPTPITADPGIASDPVEQRGTLWHLRSSLWIVLTFFLGYLSWAAFFWIGYHAQKKRWKQQGAFYLGLTFLILVFENIEFFQLIHIGLWIVSVVHAFRVREEYLMRRNAILAKKRHSKLQRKADLQRKVDKEFGLTSTADSATLTLPAKSNKSTRPK